MTGFAGGSTGGPGLPAQVVDARSSGFVYIDSRDPRITVVARLTEEIPVQSGAGGGVQELARPKRSPITSWTGHSARRITLPLIMDGWQRERMVSVERECRELERLSRALPGENAPPIVTVRGFIPMAGREFLIDDVAWGDAIRTAQGLRVRQFATVTLVEFVPGRFVVTRRQLTRPNGARGRVVVKRGDTLRKLAARELGDVRRWQEIAAMNSIRTDEIPARFIGKPLFIPARR